MINPERERTENPLLRAVYQAAREYENVRTLAKKAEVHRMRMVFAAADGGCSQSAIARQLGVSQPRVHRMINTPRTTSRDDREETT